jgi:hypothetical protein
MAMYILIAGPALLMRVFQIGTPLMVIEPARDAQVEERSAGVNTLGAETDCGDSIAAGTALADGDVGRRAVKRSATRRTPLAIFVKALS